MSPDREEAATGTNADGPSASLYDIAGEMGAATRRLREQAWKISALTRPTLAATHQRMDEDERIGSRNERTG